MTKLDSILKNRDRVNVGLMQLTFRYKIVRLPDWANKNAGCKINLSIRTANDILSICAPIIPWDKLILIIIVVWYCSRRHCFANKGPSGQGYGFSSGHVWMCELDCEESWAPKNWCFWTVVLEKTLERPLDCKEIQPVHPEGNKSWVFIGRTDAEAEMPILWPPHVKSWLIGKDPEAGRDWGQEEKGTTEDEMAGWHHQLDGHEFE